MLIISQETFLFRSRNQKMPYRHIADQLEKSELACRLHYHHMTVGRKGHSVAEDPHGLGLTEESMPPVLLTAPPEPFPSQKDYFGPRPGSIHDPHTTKLSRGPHSLPSFDTFLRDTFHHRGLSLPEQVDKVTNSSSSEDQEAWLPPSTPRLERTFSGTWLRNKAGQNEDLGGERPSDRKLQPRNILVEGARLSRLAEM